MIRDDNDNNFCKVIYFQIKIYSGYLRCSILFYLLDIRRKRSYLF